MSIPRALRAALTLTLWAVVVLIGVPPLSGWL